MSWTDSSQAEIYRAQELRTWGISFLICAAAAPCETLNTWCNVVGIANGKSETRSLSSASEGDTPGFDMVFFPSIQPLERNIETLLGRVQSLQIIPPKCWNVLSEKPVAQNAEYEEQKKSSAAPQLLSTLVTSSSFVYISLVVLDFSPTISSSLPSRDAWERLNERENSSSLFQLFFSSVVDSITIINRCTHIFSTSTTSMIVHIHYSSAAPPSSSGRRYDFGMSVVTFSHFMDSEPKTHHTKIMR